MLMSCLFLGRTFFGNFSLFIQKFLGKFTAILNADLEDILIEFWGKKVNFFQHLKVEIN